MIGDQADRGEEKIFAIIFLFVIIFFVCNYFLFVIIFCLLLFLEIKSN